LLDYKTDRINPGAGDVLKERYNVQMMLYARAVETILRKPVREKYIYSFSLGEAVRL
jgi:ATP-dependent helicase/nuclease subunit A